MEILVYAISLFAALGGFLLGYDTGVISGVLVTPSFVDAFWPLDAVVQGAIVSMLILGSFVGSLTAGVMCDQLSRKHTILVASLLFVAGALIQTFSVDVRVLYVGRFVAGLGVGQLSMAVPLYQSEIAPSKIRGRLVSLQQWAITIGIAVSFWVTFLAQDLEGDLAWRLPLGLQVAPALILAIGTLFLPHSPRWLVDRDRDDDARRVLADLRAGGDVFSAKVQEEYDDIKRSVLVERETVVGSYRELFQPNMIRRTMLGILIQAFQQLTGINSIMYYAPIIFQQAGAGGVHAALLAQGINGIVNMVAAIPAILFIDTWGRRPTLISGAFVMAGAMLVVGSLLAKFPTPPPGASYTAIVSIYVFVAGFAYSWGPIGWIYPAEIFPLSIRSKAMSLATASNWLFNYAVGLTSPILIQSIGFGLYFVFAFFGLLMAASVLLFFPETKGRSLEQMDVLFNPSHRPIEHHAEKSFANPYH